MRFLSLLLAPLLAAAWLAPRPALACGGTFCDRGPPPAPNTPPSAPMPVDQTGENILFVMDGSQVEAHVQIQYTGDPERFAWIVPLPHEPTGIETGSQPLFGNLSAATVPELQQGASQYGTCSTGPLAPGSFGCGSQDEAGDPGAAFAHDATLDPPTVITPGLEVKQKVVGSYETATLTGGTVEEVLTWLDDNGYQVPAPTAALLQGYLEQGHVFVAIKLVAGAGLDEIHPIVFRYPGDQPCIPLRLTAVAATEDMGVRAFFLATDRFVPSNYRHVILNDVRFDWIAPFLQQGLPSSAGAATGSPPIDLGNYKRVVSRAVDSPLAGGHAFVTEYSGPSYVVPQGGLAPTSALLDAGATLAAADLPGQLLSLGLMSCPVGASECTSPYALLMPLLRATLPVPPTTTEARYYTCRLCVVAATSTSQIDVAGFLAAYQTQLRDPGQRAVHALQMPWLTRLYTTISPAEMTLDPEFRRAPRASVATVLTDTPRMTCDGRQTRLVPSGREVLVTPTAASVPAWPSFGDDMPWAERIEDFGTSGDPVVLTDNHVAIDEALARYHAPFASWGSPPSYAYPYACSFTPGRRGTLVQGMLGLAALAWLTRRRVT